MTTTSEIRPQVADHNAYALAQMADCASPDTLDSPGAVWLQRVAMGPQEIIDYNTDATSADDLSDEIHEDADGAVPTYTYDVWAVFVDLAAYQEDLDDLGGPTNDMEQNAKMCLYLIAERLIRALLDEAFESVEEDDSEDSSCGD